MGEIAEQVDAVLTARRGRLPAVRAEIARWQRVDSALVALAEAVTELRRHPATPSPAAADLGQLRIAEVRPAITTAIEPLQQVERRIARDRLCVGVGGAGGTGKSTVVQSLSGLTDAWVPTGRNGPVTAVRTRVVHSPGRLRAVLVPHTAEVFRAAYLEPPPPPGRLTEIRAARWSYEGLLDRQGRPLELTGDELDHLREYLAHPSDEDNGGRPVAHRYLAVREARIECPFPHTDVGAIEIVDLPGLGGVTGTDRHHVTGLRHDLDVVLLVTRAAGAGARWNASDDAALALLDEARGFAGRRDDFVLVVWNTPADPGDEPPVPPDHAGGKHGLRVLSVDGRSPADVSARLLGPVLRHLAERLPAMDSEVYAGTRALTGAVRDQLIDLAVATKVVLDRACDLAAVGAADLYRRADELHATIAVALRGVLARARDRAGDGDPEFVDAVHRVHREIVEWIRNGLGVGYDLWCAAARRAMLRGGGAGGFTRAELDRVRTEIDVRYRVLDALLQRRLERSLRDVADAMRPLLGDRSGAAALACLGELAAATARPCPAVRAAVADLLAVRLDYDTHLSPRIRPDLASLEVDARDHPAAGDGVAELHGLIAGRAERAASRVLARLLDEAALPGWILLTAVERFTDAILGTEREIRHLARSYRHDLWPGLYRGLDADDAPVMRVTRTADELLAATAELET